MNNLFKVLIKPVGALVIASVVLSSCESDLWKDHYSYKSGSGGSVATLGKTIESMRKDGDIDARYFYETLKNTYVYENNKKTLVRYSDLLTDDQFFTIWLPTGISEDQWKVYAKTNKNDQENIEVGRDFILNHVARFSHSVGTRTYESIKMMNEKSYTADHLDYFHTVGYDKTNIRCTNGLLHILKGYIPYSPNIYDYLTGNTAYESSGKHEIYRYDTLFGKWFASFTVETIDKNKSVEGEVNIETGEKEWIDKVVIRSSEMLNKYGFIDVEDSTYAVVLPTPELWKTMYDSIGESYFAYNNDETYGDSLRKFWTRTSMITDAFFNIKSQKKSKKDSVTSALFSSVERATEKYPYHVFYKPYDDGGLFAERVDSVVCSNGIIYIRDKWPYSDSIFRRTIKLEAEDVVYPGGYTKASPRNVPYTVDGKSKTARVIMLDKKGAFEPDFAIPDNLKGKYFLKIVFFGKTGTTKSGTQVHPVVSYPLNKVIIDEKVMNGRRETDKVYTVGETVSKPDTIKLGPIVFEDCNYKTKSPKLKVVIKSFVQDANKYSTEMWIDCLMLEPVFE